MGTVITSGLGSDFDAYYALVKHQGVELIGGYNLTAEEVRAELSLPGFDPERMISLARDGDSGGVIGFCEVRAFREIPVRLYGFGYVAPEARGKGVGTRLVAENEQIAELYVPRCPEDARVVLQQLGMAPDAHPLLHDCGYVHTRDSLTMAIAFDGPPPAPQWPAGTTLRSLADGVALADFVQVNQIAFADHRNAIDEPLQSAIDRWQHMVNASRRVFEPGLFVVAHVDGEPAGVVATWTEDEDDPDWAYVQSLGVVPPFRRRGLATALLRHAFGQAYELGKRGVALNVDGASLTGAVRLYERAGMHVKQRIGVFEKEIRGGREISKQE